MALIVIKKDSNLKKPKIIVALTNSSKQEAGDSYRHNQLNVLLTLVHGILAPLVEVNNIYVDGGDIISFSLKSIGKLPSVNLVVRDRYNFIDDLDTPGVDNELKILILPKFDKVYKKINLVFYISNMRINNGYVYLTGVYKSQKFLSSNIKAFGDISTYELFDKIATETGLGFASNIEDNLEDKRYIYCDYKTYLDILNQEVACGGTKKLVLDYWVDFWDNLNLVDIRERYEAVDSDDDMQIWIAGRNKTVEEGEKIEPIKVVATLNNHPSMLSNELYVLKYNKVNKTGAQIFTGTDKLYSTYETEKNEYVDYLVEDGDVQNDIYTKFEYMGEVYGPYNYLLSSRKRAAFLLKMNSETIEITLRTPLLGLMRGHKVNFIWYDNNSSQEDKKANFEDNKLLDNSSTSNIDIDHAEINKDYGLGKFTVDKSVSGQYLIIGCDMRFENGDWRYVITLARSAKDKPNIFKNIK